MSVRKKLCRLDDIPDAGAIGVEVATEEELGYPSYSLILLRQGRKVFAYYNECPHAGRRLDFAPGKFLIDSGLLICAAHGASFFIESGRCHMGPCAGSHLARALVEVVDEEVCLAEAAVG